MSNQAMPTIVLQYSANIDEIHSSPYTSDYITSYKDLIKVVDSLNKAMAESNLRGLSFKITDVALCISRLYCRLFPSTMNTFLGHMIASSILLPVTEKLKERPQLNDIRIIREQADIVAAQRIRIIVEKIQFLTNKIDQKVETFRDDNKFIAAEVLLTISKS